MNKLKYNQTYSKTVKPRYLENYQRQSLIIITKNNDIFILHLKHFKKHYKQVKVSKQKENYTIQAKEANNE